MTVDQLISPEVPTLSPEDTGDSSMAVMEESNYHQLPLVTDERYTALIKEADLYNWGHPAEALSTAEFLHFQPAVLASVHPFEAIKVMNQMGLAVLPVIDHEHRYLGCVTKDTLLKYIAENSGINNTGGIIVLEIAPRNYTLYEIARICENEDTIILNLQSHTNAMGMLEITLKLNQSSVEAVVSSFERHSYHVKEVFGEESSNEDIEGKYHLLMNYINM
jgi:acetoin utilization protein AcuB